MGRLHRKVHVSVLLKFCSGSGGVTLSKHLDEST